MICFAFSRIYTRTLAPPFPLQRLFGLVFVLRWLFPPFPPDPALSLRWPPSPFPRSADVPTPYAQVIEDLAFPNAMNIVNSVKRTLNIQ